MCGGGGRGGQVKCAPPKETRSGGRKGLLPREESDGSGGGGSSFERYKSGMQDRNNGGSMRAVYPFINPLSNGVERAAARRKAAIIQPDHDS